MHLKSLELVGFKSFADKTLFEFHEGVTAIVGPNGCGKSNVLDAVRWVLGEQSAKALRGGEMADVIFNGTDTRKPVGYGEVSLTFSDCAADLGVDWHEVRVTRRVYRDGNSEYLLNKTVCRLKDIQNLFADTGVGRTAYSMMEQGKIDMILSSRPEDRRSVFEEAAGITKYKSQKKEAMRKLEATEVNLLRAGDIIKEVKRQIGSLQRQAGKARRYQALHSDLRVLDTHFSHRRLQTLEREIEECGTKLDSISGAERGARGSIESHETRLRELRDGLEKIDAEISTTRSELQQQQTAIASNRHRIEFNDQRAHELRELIDKHALEIATAEEKLTQQQSALQAATALVEETALLLTAKSSEFTELSNSGDGLRETRLKHEADVQALQLALAKDETRRAGLAEEAEGTRNRREAAAGQRAQLSAALENASSTREKVSVDVDSARKVIEEEAQTIASLQRAVLTAEKKVETSQAALNDLEKRFGGVERQIAEKESRLEVLRQLNEEGEGLAAGSQAVLRGMGDEFKSAVAGALAAKLDVASEYVRAIEAALGRNLHAIVLRDPQLVPQILRHLNDQQLGQAAFLLGDTGDERDLAAPILPATAIAWAAEKVVVAEELTPVVRRMLRHVAIFRTINDALAAIETTANLAAATLAGEFISREGVLFGGNGRARSDSMLERGARINVLSKEHATLLQERESFSSKVDSARAEVATAAAQLREARSNHQKAQIAQSTSAARVSVLERAHDDAARRLDQIHSEENTLDQQLSAADARIDELQVQLSEIVERIVSSTDALAQSQALRAEASAREEEASARAAELRLIVASHQQRHATLLEQQQPMVARKAELSETIAARRSDIANYEQRIASQVNETAAARDAIAANTKASAALEAKIGSFALQRASIAADVASIETKLSGARNALNDLRDQRSSQQVLQSQLQMQLENLAEHVTQRYQVDLREFVPDSYAHEKVLRAQIKRDPNTEAPVADDEALQKIISDLTHQLDAMGPVNLDAVHEYDELEERHKFLETQMNDLTSARRELLDVIARINSTTQKLFAETFAQVRVNFREMFAELFGGGRADLALLDENDPLNCGIDIIAKPPGKQLQGISLLSGGERTMTAVALLFAIYMVRPSPFCILDEMDAPLDESNINRFIKVLDRFADQSQFIIITHNKRTIAKADILYGVTMEERGVSKLVGMKMAPAPAIGTAPPQPSVADATQQHFQIDETDDAGHLAAR